MTDLPVHALVTAPGAEETLPDGRVELRGIAWGGQGGIAAVDVRVDRGTWRPAKLRPADGPWGALWSAERTLSSGQHVVSARARDAAGETQPDAPPPNPDGYANNSVHRVAFRVR